MDHESPTLPMRIAITVALISYFLTLIFVALIAWDMLLDKQRIDGGPWTSGVVGSTYARKADAFGAVTYKLETLTGVVECQDDLSLGPKGHFVSGQTIDLAIGEDCGRAVSVTKRVWPWTYFCIFIFTGMFPVIAITRRCVRDAKQAAKDSSGTTELITGVKDAGSGSSPEAAGKGASSPTR